MNYIIFRCEDLARGGPKIASLLEGARTAHLQQLAQAGAAGLLRPASRQRALGRFQLLRGLFGLGPGDPEAAPGLCYAASANVSCEAGESAWCCELVTQHDGRVMDATGGDIPTKESRLLIQALNEQLGSAHRRWEVGDASHHLLVARDPGLHGNGHLSVDPPELLIGRSWKRSLPKAPASQALRALIEQAGKLLESHPINRVRVDLGENPANMVWLWGSGSGNPGPSFTERTHLSGALVSASFAGRGLAKCLGLHWEPGPTTLKEEPLRRLVKSLAELSHRYDVVCVHVPVDQTDPVERLCIMERLDQLVLKPLTESLSAGRRGRLLAAIDDRNGSVPFVAVGEGLPQQPVARLQSEMFAQSPLQYDDGAKLFRWFTNTTS